MFWRVIIGVALLAALCAFVGAGELLAVFAGLRWEHIILLIVISVLMIWISCLKWRMFLRAGGGDAPLSELMRLYVIGYFVSTFTPSIVGGDIARSYALGRRTGSQRDAFVSTFLERFTGLLAMSLLAAGFVACGSRAAAGAELAVLLIAAVNLLIALWCFSGSVGPRIGGGARWITARVLPGKWGARARAMLDKVELAMAAARDNQRLFVRAMLISFLFHVLTVLNTYVAGLAVGWQEPDFVGLFVVVPLVLLVGALPVSFGGLGIQEGAFVFFLRRLGASDATGLALGIVLRAKVLLIALLGGLVVSFGRKKTA